MISLEKPFRLATPQDAAALAELVNIAGHGLPWSVWSKIAAEGQDPWEIGAKRQAARAAQGEVFVVDEGEGAIASLTGYVIGPEPEPVGEDMPAVFRPLQELENMAPDSWYVNVLACYPEHRGKGHGTRLLDLAEKIADDSGLKTMSVIVAGDNSGARRLYERQGYVEVARRPCVPGDWESDTEEWVLLVKKLDFAS